MSNYLRHGSPSDPTGKLFQSLSCIPLEIECDKIARHMLLAHEANRDRFFKISYNLTGETLSLFVCVGVHTKGR